jgi:hypothetical protein
MALEDERNAHCAASSPACAVQPHLRAITRDHTVQPEAYVKTASDTDPVMNVFCSS